MVATTIVRYNCPQIVPLPAACPPSAPYRDPFRPAASYSWAVRGKHKALLYGSAVKTQNAHKMSMLAMMDNNVLDVPPAKGPPSEGSHTPREVAEKFRGEQEKPRFDASNVLGSLNDLDETQETLRADGRSDVDSEAPGFGSAVLEDESAGANGESNEDDQQEDAAVKPQALAGRQAAMNQDDVEVEPDCDDASELSWRIGETEEEHEQRMQMITEKVVDPEDIPTLSVSFFSFALRSDDGNTAAAQVKELMSQLGNTTGSLEQRDQQLREATRTIKRLEKEKAAAEKERLAAEKEARAASVRALLMLPLR